MGEARSPKPRRVIATGDWQLRLTRSDVCGIDFFLAARERNAPTRAYRWSRGRGDHGRTGVGGARTGVSRRDVEAVHPLVGLRELRVLPERRLRVGRDRGGPGGGGRRPPPPSPFPS